jgi:hypothetical protein
MSFCSAKLALERVAPPHLTGSAQPVPKTDETQTGGGFGEAQGEIPSIAAEIRITMEEVHENPFRHHESQELGTTTLNQRQS